MIVPSIGADAVHGGGVGVPLKISPGELAPVDVQRRLLLDTLWLIVWQEKSAPTLSSVDEQLAVPVPQEHAPHMR